MIRHQNSTKFLWLLVACLISCPAWGASSCIFDVNNFSTAIDATRMELDEGIDLAPCISAKYPQYTNQDIAPLINQAIRIAETYRPNTSGTKRFVGGRITLPAGTFYLHSSVEFFGVPNVGPLLTTNERVTLLELISVSIEGAGKNLTTLVYRNGGRTPAEVSNTAALQRARSVDHGYVTPLLVNGETSPIWKDPIVRYSVRDLTVVLQVNAMNVSGIDLAGISHSIFERFGVVVSDLNGTCQNCTGVLLRGSPIVQVGSSLCTTSTDRTNLEGGESPYFNSITDFTISGSPLSQESFSGVRLTEELQWSPADWAPGYAPSGNQYTKIDAAGNKLIAVPRGPNANTFDGVSSKIENAQYGFVLEAGVGNTVRNISFENITSADIVVGGASPSFPPSPFGDLYVGGSCTFVGGTTPAHCQCAPMVGNPTFRSMGAAQNFFTRSQHTFNTGSNQRLIEMRNKAYSNTVEAKTISNRDTSLPMLLNSFWMSGVSNPHSRLCDRGNKIILNKRDRTGCFSGNELALTSTWSFHQSLDPMISQTLEDNYHIVRRSLCNGSNGGLKAKLECP